MEAEIHLFFRDDSELRETFVTLLGLIFKAADLFPSSKVEQKRRIIQFVFSNLLLEGRELRYTLNPPFDRLLDLASCQKWWTKVVDIRTFAYSEVIALRPVLEVLKC